MGGIMVFTIRQWHWYWPTATLAAGSKDRHGSANYSNEEKYKQTYKQRATTTSAFWTLGKYKELLLEVTINQYQQQLPVTMVDGPKVAGQPIIPINKGNTLRNETDFLPLDVESLTLAKNNVFPTNVNKGFLLADRGWMKK